VSLVAGIEIDEKKIVRALANHAGKNRTNAYLLAGLPEEQAAKARGDWELALSEFRKLQAEFHEGSNDAKNASLYVDFKEGEFVSPNECITAEMLAETAERNAMFLDLTAPYLRLIARWEERPEDAEAEIGAFVELAGAMHGKNPDEQMRALQDLINKFMARYQARG
jgi:AbiV family abortive infection protein